MHLCLRTPALVALLALVNTCCLGQVVLPTQPSEPEEVAWFASVAPADPQSVIFENDPRPLMVAYYERWAAHFDSRRSPIKQSGLQPESLRAILRVALKPDGSLADVTVARSSRNRHIDESALRAVRDAAPYPRVPGSAAGPTGMATLLVPFDYMQMVDAAFVRVGTNLAAWREFRNNIQLSLRSELEDSLLSSDEPVDFETSLLLEGGRVQSWKVVGDPADPTLAAKLQHALDRIAVRLRGPERPRRITVAVPVQIAP